MAIEAWIRDLTCQADVILQDRGYPDDLVSIAAILGLDVPKALIRFSAWAFPVKRIFYLSAGHECEYGRIAQMDLSESIHERKSTLYDMLFTTLQLRIDSVCRIDTSSRTTMKKRIAEMMGAE